MQWPHAPSHLFVPNAAYIVTAGTYGKMPYFEAPERRDFLLQTIFEEALRWGWALQAWAVLPNHYHWVGIAPEEASTLRRMIQAVHSRTAIWVNREDHAAGRKVWHSYWDTWLSWQSSYLARLHYVHQNPVKHGVVRNAANYRWCSMAWFEGHAPNSFRKTVLSLKLDAVRVEDDF